MVFCGCVGFLWVLVCVFGCRFVVGWSVLVLLMGLWVLLEVGGFGFMGFVDVVALLVVEGLLGFACGRWSQGLWVLLGQVVGFVGFVLQFFLHL